MADPSSSSAIEQKMASTGIADTTAAVNSGQVEPHEVSKSAAKKAAKQEKLAAEKANKSATNTTKEAGRAEAKKAVSKAPKKKIEGAALIGIDVSKEEDFSGWYQQVLTKGDMLDYYDVSGCYILKVHIFGLCASLVAHVHLACIVFHMGGDPAMVQQEDKKAWGKELLVPDVRLARCAGEGKGSYRGIRC